VELARVDQCGTALARWHGELAELVAAPAREYALGDCTGVHGPQGDVRDVLCTPTGRV